jgi:hypothetical protein
MRKLITCLLVLCMPVMVAAEDLGLEKGDKSVITLGLKGGVGLPQLSSALDTTFCVHLEAAYQFPFWGSRLGLITSLGYTQPTGSGSGTDPRLPGGEYTWETTQRQTTLDIGVLLKFMERSSPWNLGLAAGARRPPCRACSPGSRASTAWARGPCSWSCCWACPSRICTPPVISP